MESLSSVVEGGDVVAPGAVLAGEGPPCCRRSRAQGKPVGARGRETVPARIPEIRSPRLTCAVVIGPVGVPPSADGRCESAPSRAVLMPGSGSGGM